MFRFLLFILLAFYTINIAITPQLIAAKNLDLDGIKFSVNKTSDFLACLKPLEIKGMNSVYIKNNTGEPVYLIEMNGSIGDCFWGRDQLTFTSKVSNSDIQKVLNQYPTKLYLSTNIKIKFKITKLNEDSSIDLKNINLPYFLVITNSENEDILFQKDLIIKIDLSKKKIIEQTGKNISLTLEIPLKDYLSIQALTGIYIDDISFIENLDNEQRNNIKK
jgi:hypothetical protein